MSEQRFETTLREEEGEAAFFIVVPEAVVAALGKRKRPPVVVSLNGYRYRTTIATYGGQFVLPVRRAIREAAGLRPGDAVTVVIAVDEAPRVVELPDEARVALAADPVAQAAFDRLSYTHRKEYVDWIVEAKRDETRRRRVERAVAMIKEGKREPR